jgi:hypothetical protein
VDLDDPSLVLALLSTINAFDLIRVVVRSPDLRSSGIEPPRPSLQEPTPHPGKFRPLFGFRKLDSSPSVPLVRVLPAIRMENAKMSGNRNKMT